MGVLLVLEQHDDSTFSKMNGSTKMAPHVEKFRSTVEEFEIVPRFIIVAQNFHHRGKTHAWKFFGRDVAQ